MTLKATYTHTYVWTEAKTFPDAVSYSSELRG